MNANRSRTPSEGVPRRGSGSQTTPYGTFPVETVKFTQVVFPNGSTVGTVAVHARVRFVAFTGRSDSVSLR